MRIVIVSLMLMFLTFLVAFPCRDGRLDTGVSISERVTNTQDNKDNHKGICSVFCFCHCCGVVLSEHQFSEFSQGYTEVKQSPEILYSEGFIPIRIPFGIWQPPKYS
ncbi:MAG: hypothetical protein FDW93_00640 [Bergeyella sp.]|nr:hypothetical protein [Bergeyella sp.]